MARTKKQKVWSVQVGYDDLNSLVARDGVYKPERFVFPLHNQIMIRDPIFDWKLFLWFMERKIEIKLNTKYRYNGTWSQWKYTYFMMNADGVCVEQKTKTVRNCGYDAEYFVDFTCPKEAMLFKLTFG